MGEVGRLIRNTGIIALGGMATKLVQFLLLPLYTSILSTSEYGVVDYLNILALFCVPAVSLLMDEALFRFLVDCENDDDRCIVTTAACVVLVAGCVLFSLIVGVLSFVWHSDMLMWVAMLVIAGSFLQMMSAVLRGSGDTVAFASMNFFASLSMIILNVLFLTAFSAGAKGMLAATVIAQGGVALVYAFKSRIWAYVDVSRFDCDVAKKLVRYSAPLIPNKVSWTIMNMSSRLVIMGSLGAGPAGIFAVAYKFPNVMDQIYGFFYMSWKESSARVLGSDEDEVLFYNRVYRALRRFMMSVVLVMTALMPVGYSLLIDASYGKGVLYVPILLLATYFSNISGFYGGIFTAHKDTGIMGTTTIVSAAVCLTLNVILIPTIGLYGAALSTLIAMIAVNEYRRVKVTRYATLEESTPERIVTLVAMFVVGGCFYCNALSGSVQPLVVGVVVTVCYAVGMNWEILRRLITALASRMHG